MRRKHARQSCSTYTNLIDLTSDDHDEATNEESAFSGVRVSLEPTLSSKYIYVYYGVYILF